MYDEITLSPKEMRIQIPEISPRKPIIDLKTTTQNFDSYL